MSAKNRWSIDDVMDYFSELFKQDEESQKKVREMMTVIMSIVENERHDNYFSRMHRVREILMSKGVTNIPFRAIYHRKIKSGRKES